MVDFLPYVFEYFITEEITPKDSLPMITSNIYINQNIHVLTLND